ncbi:MAG: hypothetical protein JW940_38450 [Polyangiaceae bacterium]|nr:hypothetical protein [Polyangiaceae bacterium]
MTPLAWPAVRLGQVLRQVSDGHRVDAEREYPNFGIYSFGRGLFRKTPISGTTTSARTLFRVRRGQFIYSRLFAFEGAYGVVSNEFDGSFVSSEYPTFETEATRLIPEYLAFYFRVPAVWKRVARGAVGLGDRRRRVQPEQLLGHELPLPPLPEQYRIVAQLEQVFAKARELRQLRHEATLEMRRILLGSFARITKDAPRRPMSVVAPIVRRPVDVDEVSQYPELGIRSFGHGTFHKPALAGIDVGGKKLYEIHPGDLVFSNVFAWEGAVAVVQAGDEGRFGSHRFITCVPRDEMTTAPFLCFYFLTAEGLAQLDKASPGGAGRNRTLGLEALRSISVPVPPISAQRRFDHLQGLTKELAKEQLSADRQREALEAASLARVFAQE